MLAKRIIPCLDCDLSVAQGRVVKGVKFKELKCTGVPWELAEQYYNEGADEICFLDITASAEKRETMIKVIEKTAENVFIPLTVGGGIKSLEDARKVFSAGADKITLNTAAIKNPELISKISKVFGNQAVVVAIDAKKKIDGNGKKFWEASIYGGREFTGLNAIEWAKKAEEFGAGEILLTSMDCDGTKDGFDIELTKSVAQAVKIPVIASGGAGDRKSFYDILTEGKADAALAASIFHFGEYTSKQIKEYLKDKGVNVRV